MILSKQISRVPVALTYESYALVSSGMLIV